MSILVLPKNYEVSPAALDNAVIVLIESDHLHDGWYTVLKDPSDSLGKVTTFNKAVEALNTL